MDVAPSVPLLRQEQRDCERRSVQRIKSILKKIGSKNGVRLMFLSVYVFGFAIPAGYAYFAAYPAKEAIFTDEGTAHFQYRVKRGYMLMVKGKDYSCESPQSRSNPDCFAGQDDPQRLDGKIIAVDWFLQPVYLFVERRRVVDIRYDGKSQLPSDHLRRNLQWEKESAPGFALFAFILLFLGLLLAEWVERIRKRNERKLD